MKLFLLFMLCVGLASAQDAVHFPPRLSEPLKFANLTVTDIVSQVEASNLMSKKVFIGENEVDAYEILGTNWNGPRIYADSASDYEAAIKAGYKPYTTFEVAMTSWFEKPAKTLHFMEKAQPSIHSLFLTKDLKYLPVSLLNWNDTDQKKQLDDDTARGITLKDYTASYIKRHIPSIKIKGNTVSFSDDECDYVVTELARGDFDHDGYEDALVSVGTKYQGGEGAYFEYFLVSRTDTKQRQLKIIAFNPAKPESRNQTNQFLHCEPSIVKLVGTIRNEVFPGLPNYKDLANGDLAESYWILKLNEPIDVAEDPEYPVPDENSPQLNVSDVQLNLDVHLDANYKAYQQFLNREVVVTGELTQGFTVHHKTAVMMWVRDIKGTE